MPNVANIVHSKIQANKSSARSRKVLSSVLRDIMATRAAMQISDEYLIFYGTITEMDSEAIEIRLINRDGQRMIVPRSTILLIRDLGAARRRFPFSSQKYRYRLQLKSCRNTIG